MNVPSPDAVAASTSRRCRGWLAGHRDAMVADLVAYAEQETPSDDRALLAAGLAHVEGWVTDRLGSPGSRARHESAEHGAVLVLEYDGAGERSLTLLAHYDTVWSAGTLADWPVRIDGDRLTGPGVFDMKAGLVQAVWAVRALRAAGVAHPPLRLLLNGDEEIGSPFSRPLIEKASADAAAVLVFEAAAGGAVKTARKGVGLWDVHVRGVESHAGLDPTAGASAIDELARVVRILHDGHRPRGRHQCERRRGARRHPRRTWWRAGPRQASTCGCGPLPSRPGSTPWSPGCARTTRVPRSRRTGGWNRPVMERSDGIAAVYVLARAAAAKLGVDLAETAVGGASDGNFAAAMGRPVLDGLGAVGAGAHARHEHVSIEGMIERAAVAAGVLAAFAR